MVNELWGRWRVGVRSMSSELVGGRLVNELVNELCWSMSSEVIGGWLVNEL